MIRIFLGDAAPKGHLHWEIYKGASQVKEDFGGAKVFLWLVGAGNKVLVDCTALDGVIEADLPEMLPVGVYGVCAQWVKDSCYKRMKAEVQKIFAVTNVEADATPVNGDHYSINIKSSSATYGYDGLDAYEKSVLAGKTLLSEEEWLAQQNLTTEEIHSYQGLVSAERERAQASENHLQEQIDDIISGGTTVDLTLSKDVVKVGETTNIILNATASSPATSITLTKNGTDIASGSGTSLYYVDAFSGEEEGVVPFWATFIINGIKRTATKSVSVARPILYGSGDEYTDAVQQASARTTPAGTYQVTVAHNGDYVWFVVPDTMSIQGATMGGFDFPLEDAFSVVVDNTIYYAYRSSNTYDAGVLTIVLS